MDATTQFQEAIITHGWNPGSIYPDGKIHRFDTDKPKDKAGWYCFFGEAGVFGSWKGSVKHKWSSKNGSMSSEERSAFKQQMAKAEKKRATLKKKSQKRALKRAHIIWQKAQEAFENHPYLIAKQIKAHGARQYKRVLLIPLLSLKDKEIQSLQFISANSDKRFLKEGEIKGNLFWISGDKTLCLCEGFSTGASIFESTGHTVLIGFNAGNLEAVTEQIRAKYPNRPLIICGDNDAFTTKPDGKLWNPGREKAVAVAWKYNAKVILPLFRNTTTKPTDFNDLMALEGADAVRKQISTSKHPSQLLLEECEENKGAAFRSEYLEVLGRLKQQDLPTFRELRHKLKELHVGVVALDEAINVKTTDSNKGAGDEPEHLDIARTVIQSFGDVNLLYHQSFFWIWNKGGLWMKSDDKIFKKSIHTCVKGMNFRKSEIDSILDMAKTEIFLPNHRFDINTSAINCLNGELFWTGSKWELKEHKREHYRTTQIPLEYDQEATAPRFEQFLAEVFQSDSDQTEKAFVVCEALGYSLLSSTEYEKFFLLIGPGANGKSVLMETLASLVGHHHVAAVQPSQFDNRFQRAHLHCKLVNLVTEIAEGHTIKDAELKALVSGELTTAEHKHKPPFDFQPYSTCWFGSNHMPHTRDFSDALFRRAIIIPFNRIFQEHEQDKQLKSKLKEELPGILNLALEAVAGVFKRGEFTNTESCKRAKREWRLNCDQVQQFAADECLFVPGIDTASGKLFKTYRQWAEDAGIKRTVNRNNFTARMCRLGAEKAKGTGGTRILAGVGLKRHVERQHEWHKWRNSPFILYRKKTYTFTSYRVTRNGIY